MALLVGRNAGRRSIAPNDDFQLGGGELSLGCLTALAFASWVLVVLALVLS